MLHILQITSQLYIIDPFHLKIVTNKLSLMPNESKNACEIILTLIFKCLSPSGYGGLVNQNLRAYSVTLFLQAVPLRLGKYGFVLIY